MLALSALECKALRSDSYRILRRRSDDRGAGPRYAGRLRTGCRGG